MRGGNRTKGRVAEWAVAWACVAGALASGAAAELPPLIPREVLFGNPERLLPAISPDGLRLAYLRPDSSDVLQVWVRTLDGDDDRPVTKDPQRGIELYGWTWDPLQLYYLQDNAGDENFHVYLTNVESGETRDLTPIAGVAAAVLALDPDHPREMVVTMNRRDPALFEPWRCDLETGALELLAENPGNVRTWLADTDLAIRGQTVGRSDGGGELRVRDAAGGEWRTIVSWAVEDDFQPLAFSRDGRSIHVKTTIGADTRGLYAIEIATGALTLIADDPGADAGDVLSDPRTYEVQAIVFDRLRPIWRVLDPSVQSDFDRLAQVAQGSLGFTSRDLADRYWVVSFDSDVGATKYFLWDRSAGAARHLFDAIPRLSGHVLAPVRALEIAARDGLSLPCYLTLPVGVPARGLPLVLSVHGGPWWRDYWGYDPNTQWLANRGYAVLQVNYRGSAGFGKSFLRAARREFAGKMHDDLIDALDWTIREGIVDPARVGIMGASYGGYATLVGLSFTPERFACGVDLVGPSNLVTLVESFPPYWKPFLSVRWYPLVGDPSDPRDRADMLARSPISRVDQIRAPLLVGQGANDPRVKQEESDRIVAALRERAIPVEYVVFPDEGHGLARPANRLVFWTAAEAFLAQHLGGRAQPPGKIPPDSQAQWR